MALGGAGGGGTLMHGAAGMFKNNARVLFRPRGQSGSEIDQRKRV